MFNNTVKFVLSLTFILGTFSTQAQQLIRETSKNDKSENKWKIEWGLMSGLGVYNALQPDQIQPLNMPEGKGSYSIMYAPRPEAEVGFFGEIGKVNSIFSFQARLSYTLRAIPEPVFYGPQITTEKEYRSTYLNGITVGGIFFFKPIKKFKIGLGLEASNFLVTKKMEDADHGEYTQAHSSSVAFRTVLSYNVNPRIDMNVYGAVGKSMETEHSMKPDFVSAGVMMTYRLCGKEIHVKKQVIEEKKVYKIDYSK